MQSAPGSQPSMPILAIVNPQAGHGRCGRLVAAALDRLRSGAVAFDLRETRCAGHATELARDGFRQGYRRFISVGGDGTTFEIVNGLFPEAAAEDPPILGFLPLGTGNSFLRDFAENGLEHAVSAIISGRTRPCDVLRLTHTGGVLHYINLLSLGFVADVCVVANRRYKRLGEIGYLFGIIECLVRLNRRSFPLRVDGSPEVDRRRCLLLTFNNSQYTGGKMKLAPLAQTDDGMIEFVHWGPIGRLGLIRQLPALYDGSHIHHPLAWRCSAHRIDFEQDDPVDVMVDGEVITLRCRSLDVLPSALHVMA